MITSRAPATILILAVALLASACTSHTQGFKYSKLKDRCVGSFLLESGDVVRVSVWKEPNHSRDQVLVRPDGQISLPLLGDIKAAGMTIPQLTKDVQVRLKKFVPDPRVDLSLVTARSYQVFVMGQVARSGGFTSQAPMSVLEALARAGGLSPFAKSSEIFIIWKTSSGELRIPFNYDEILTGVRRDQNIRLCRGDIVMVP